MTIWVFLISTFAVVYCRPQINPQDPSAVEVDKQHVIEINPTSKELFQDSEFSDLTNKQLEENTKEILEKIALVNEKQGLNKKKSKPNYQHFPFSYMRSQEDKSRQRSDFKFPRDPFTNPILDYIENKRDDLETNRRNPLPDTNEQQDSNVKDEDQIPGHYIKRKIVHQQTMLIPGYPGGYMPGTLNSDFSSPPQHIPSNFYGMNRIPEIPNKPGNLDTKKNELEKQTIDNIKNIIENSQYGSKMGLNPYSQPFNPYHYQQTRPTYNNYQVYGPYTWQQLYRPAKQQWQWPLGQYFPIVIRDPIVHMMNAMTTMIEYGPQGSSGNSCAKDSTQVPMSHKRTSESKIEESSPAVARKIPENAKLNYNIVNNGKGAELTVSNEDDSNLTTVIDIEDLQITDSTDEPVKLNLSFRKSKENQEIKKTVFYNSSKPVDDVFSNPLIQTLQITKTQISSNETSRQSPPVRDQILHDDELDDEEFEKAEDVQVSHDGNKKLFSKDNTGSGIFVHKIKVRKGGVAIAGPGGIATAGSGGTAIVGPNGFAYTHPDSLAIAGSGTKVVAVEPTINLSQVFADHNKNKTRGQGHSPPRIGKIVAVGPVIYYNRG